MLGHNNKPFHGPTSKHTSKLKLCEFPWYIWRIRKKLGLITISRVWKWQDNWMVCVPWGRVSYPGFKEMSIINTQLPNFRFHNMRKVRINYSNVSVCSWKMVARAFPRKCEQDWTTFPPQGKASQHHVGYEVHTLLTVFMEVEDNWPLSSLIKSSNILSNEFIASGQALTAKYHIVHQRAD